MSAIRPVRTKKGPGVVLRAECPSRREPARAHPGPEVKQAKSDERGVANRRVQTRYSACSPTSQIGGGSRGPRRRNMESRRTVDAAALAARRRFAKPFESPFSRRARRRLGRSAGPILFLFASVCPPPAVVKPVVSPARGRNPSGRDTALARILSRRQHTGSDSRSEPGAGPEGVRCREEKSAVPSSAAS